MSQPSTTSSQYSFLPINHHDGNGESNTQSTTRLDKEVAAVSTLQSNADVLKDASLVLDGIIDTLKTASFKGKRNVVAKLKSVQTTLSNVRLKVGRSAVSLSHLEGYQEYMLRGKEI